MPIPSTIDDLSPTAISNGPSGNETPSDGDGYLRAHAGFIAELRDKLDGTSNTGTVKNAAFSGTQTGDTTFSGTITLSGAAAGKVIGSTYSPTISAVTNVASAGSTRAFFYKRINNIVEVTGIVNVTPSSGGAFVVGITLPVASDIADPDDVVGDAVETSSLGSGFVFGSTSANEAYLSATPANALTRAYHVRFTYEIL